jgi:hypothetical protein
MPVSTPPLVGMDKIANFRFGSSLTTSGVLTFAAYELLQVQFNIEGYSGSAIASLRFNGDTTVTNYASEYLTWSTAAPTVSNVLGTFGGFKLGANGVTVQRSGLLTIKNNSSVSHLITCASLTHGGGGTSVDVQSSGGGKYVTGTAGQITSIELITDVNGITMPAGTSLAVFGYNP